MTDTAITATTQNNLPTKTLAELKMEIKFHLGQMAGHAVEIGKLLIQAKAQVVDNSQESGHKIRKFF